MLGYSADELRDMPFTAFTTQMMRGWTGTSTPNWAPDVRSGLIQFAQTMIAAARFERTKLDTMLTGDA